VSKISAADVLELSVEERLALVEDIWNSIAESPTVVELTDEDKHFIDERLGACRKNPSESSPWKEALARVAVVGGGERVVSCAQ
jgi:putative addiction module component (TIGR02574 family)